MATPETNKLDDNDGSPSEPSPVEQRNSLNSGTQQSSYGDHMSMNTIDNDDEPPQELKRIEQPKRSIPAPKIRTSKQLPKSMVLSPNKSSAVKQSPTVNTR